MRKRVALAQTPDQRARHPADGRAVQRPGRADPGDHVRPSCCGLWDQTQPAVVFVTHDLEEAIALADKVVVMTAGPGTVKAVFDIDLPRPRVGPGDPLRPAFRRALPADLGEPARRGEPAYAREDRSSPGGARDRPRAHATRAPRRSTTTDRMSSPPLPKAAATPSAEPSRCRRGALRGAARALLGIVVVAARVVVAAGCCRG